MLSGLGLTEILIILLVTLVVIGPEKIPDVARMLGKGVREVRRASNMFRDMFMLEEGSDYGGRSTSNTYDKQRALDREPAPTGGVAHTVTHGPTGPRMRPVRLEVARRATHISEVALDAAEPADDCSFEALTAPRAQ